jgi:hypothetical protein
MSLPRRPVDDSRASVNAAKAEAGAPGSSGEHSGCTAATAAEVQSPRGRVRLMKRVWCRVRNVAFGGNLLQN